jgi:hypothetical protein
MQCPPGLILNPKTLRCVRVTGKVGRGLYNEGYVRNAEIQAAAHAVPFGYQPRNRNRFTIRKPGFLLRREPKLAISKPCPPGTTRSLQTRKCIKLGGKAYKKVFGSTPVYEPVPSGLSEPKVAIPLGSSGAAPLANKPALLDWTTQNCKYANNILTGRRFADDSVSNLQSIVRLHDGVCMAAPSLNSLIGAQHKAGQIATLPHDKTTHLTLGDFNALREVMQRTVPGYKIPARIHQQHPPGWELYVASDNRSGSEFVTILYVDVTKAVTTATGVEYPQESIRVDLGYLPRTDQIQNLLAILQRLDAMNRLLIPVAGGWKPAYGFPYQKAHWANNRTARMQKLNDTLLSALQ